MTRVAVPYMVKSFKTSVSEPGQMILKLGMNHRRLKLYKCCINDDLFDRKVKKVSIDFIMRKTLRILLTDKKLQQITRETKCLCLYKMVDPLGLFAPSLGSFANVYMRL